MLGDRCDIAFKAYKKAQSSNGASMLQNQQVLQDRYQLEKLLGQNAGRETWLACDRQTQTLVVVKLLAFSDRVQWDQLRLFEREAQVLKSLTHPQIPQYQDFFCLDDRFLWFVLVQSYIPGTSLKQFLEQGRAFDETAVRQIASQILQILIYLHGLSPPVLHRDIKPSNLLLDGDRKVHLVDFGAVQDRVAKEGATFTVVGTYGYAPLEQLGGRATPASDLYALGATLIHLLTGVAPAHLPQEHGRLQFTEGLHLNPGFMRWLWRLTEVDATRRFATAREALEGLQKNEAAIASSMTTKPKTSQIQLQKSPQQLEIWISNAPQTRRRALKSVLFWGFVGGIIAFYAPGLFAWLIVVGLGFVGALIGTAYVTHVRFDSQHFEICWSCFGFSRRKQGRIADLHQVSKEALKVAQRLFPAVKLTVGRQEYLITAFNPPLTEAERDWLLQEIQQWLGFE